MKSHITSENNLAADMLQYALHNQTIIHLLCEIAMKLRDQVFLPLKSTLLEEKDYSKLKRPYQDIIFSWSSKHSEGDAEIGALLPEFKWDELKQQRRIDLLDAIQKRLSNPKVTNLHELLSLIKTLDDVGYAYYLIQNALPNPSDRFKELRGIIFPTQEETDMRCEREENVFSLTHGIGTELNVDLTSDKNKKSWVSGKSKFTVLNSEDRFTLLLKQYNLNSNEDKKPSLEKKLQYYKIPLSAKDQGPPSSYAKRYQPWFEKLSKIQGKSLPLIASVSQSTARLLITLLDINAFTKADGNFDFDKAQLLTNCLMGYFVYCGHHSVTEVMEVWNRLVDYIAIKQPQQISITTDSKEKLSALYIKEALAEQKLPYGKIGDCYSILHKSCLDEIKQSSTFQMKIKY